MPSKLNGRAFGDDTVVQWMDVSLSMQGDFLGIPATKKTARLPMITIFTFRDMLVESETTHYDTADMCNQLGLDRSTMMAALHKLAEEFA